MLWEMATGLIDEYNVLVFTGADLDFPKYFRTNGKPLVWQGAPKVEPFVERRSKRQKPRADIEYITWGALVLNTRAYNILYEVLNPFGEFLQMDCLGEPLFFYNVTTLHSVVDYEKSEKIGTAVTKPAFVEEKIPSGICIFKDELMARTAIYTNAETKLKLERLLGENGLTGLTIGEAGKLLTR